MNLANRCRSNFDATTRTQGEASFRQGSVKIFSRENDRVLATVEPSMFESYEVTLDCRSADGHEITVSCSCPDFCSGRICQHVWATILATDHRAKRSPPPSPQSGLSATSATARRTVDDEPLEAPDQDLGQAPTGLLGDIMQKVLGSSAAQPTPRPQPAPAPKQPKLAKWQSAFQSLRHADFEPSVPDPWDCFQRRDRVAWYALNLSQSVASANVTIDLLQQVRIKSGELGQLKSLTFQAELADEFDDRLDRDLLRQLLALAANTNRKRGYYDYPYAYNYGSAGQSVSQVSLTAATCELFLPRLAATGRFRWSLKGQSTWDEAEPIAWDAGEPWRFELVITADDEQQQWALHGQFARGQEVRPMRSVLMLAPAGLVLFRDMFCRTEDPASAWPAWIYRQPPIQVPYARRADFLQTLWQFPALPPIVWPQNLVVEQVRQTPQPCLSIRPGRAECVANLGFLYGEARVNLQDPTAVALSGAGDPPAVPTRVWVRDRVAEQARLAELGRLPIVLDNNSYNHSQPEKSLRIKAKQLPAIVEELMSRGWRVEVQGQPYRTAGNFRMQVVSGIDWFDLDASMDFGGVDAPLPDLLAALRKGQNFVELSDGSRGILPEEWLRRYTSLADLGEATDGKVRFVRSQALLLDALLAEQHGLQVDRPFAEYRERLRGFSGVAAQDPPPSFHGVLRDYQRQGLGWLHFLCDLGLGGCLADDMGLGKTVQVLAFLEQRRCRVLSPGETRLPSVVIVPKSLVFNWIDEAQRFTPQLRVLNYTGTQRIESRAQWDECDLIVTTYGILRQDVVDLKDRQFDYVILDEAQAIKNAGSQVAKASLLLRSQHRLALSGTPIENHLGELWSLFEFLNPRMLGRSSTFAALCKTTKVDDHESLRRLARAVAPFILRRTKDQVLKELPEKTEQTLFCDLTPKERKDYNELRDYYRAKLTNVIDERGLKNSKIHVLEALLRLRQAACHPGLLNPTKVDAPSTKLEVLLEQLEEVIGEGHKALVFSQFTSLLAIVRRRLDEASIRYEYLDGQTQDRRAVVERFQHETGCPVFLISLKAGGHGLNLTAADYVFILDPWWNPAVEMQAIDRTHRIGQTRRVFAYRIITRDTVEEKVLSLQDSKRDLANAIITANDSLIRQLTAEDLQLILS